MKLKQLFTDEDAVSPVIGVILMVAITVILAAVIGTFVLGLGNQVGNNAPQASFTFDYTGSSGELQVVHNGGGTISGSQLSLKSDTNYKDDDGTPSATKSETWQTLDDTGGTDVSAGDSVTIVESTADAFDSATVRLIWTSEGGDSSAELGKWTGPDA